MNNEEIIEKEYTTYQKFIHKDLRPHFTVIPNKVLDKNLFLDTWFYLNNTATIGLYLYLYCNPWTSYHFKAGLIEHANLYKAIEELENSPIKSQVCIEKIKDDKGNITEYRIKYDMLPVAYPSNISQYYYDNKETKKDVL